MNLCYLKIFKRLSDILAFRMLEIRSVGVIRWPLLILTILLSICHPRRARTETFRNDWVGVEYGTDIHTRIC